MKHLLLSLALSLTGCAAAFAQLPIDAKINVGSLLTGGVNVAAEFNVSDNIGIAAGFAYSGLGISFNNDDFRYRSTRFIPEFRYYVSPDYGADRFYIGAYGKGGVVTARNRNSDLRETGARAVIGLLVGYKWILNNNMLIELNTGLGRGTIFSSDPIFDTSATFLTAVDLRLGLLAGYRF